MDRLLQSDSITQDNLILMVKDLQERLKQLETHALTSQNIKANKVAVGAESVLASIPDGDIASVPWTDHSEVASITGWSSFTVKTIFYKRVGRRVDVWFYLRGESDNANVSFGMPWTNLDILQNRVINVMNSGTNDWGYCNMLVNGSAVNFFRTAAGLAWTSSGEKYVIGHLTYNTDQSLAP